MLVATGRAANVEDIGLETTKVEVDAGDHQGQRPDADPRAARLRDRRHRRRAVAGPYGGATRGSSRPTRSPATRDVHEIDYVEQPRATYCRPEIASVGLTEQQCQERGLPYKVGKVPFQAIAKAIIGGEYEGFAKVIGNTETGRHARRPHRRAACHGPHRRGVARLRARGDAVGDRRGDAPPPDPVRGHRRGGHGRRRAVDQLLTHAAEAGPGGEGRRPRRRAAPRRDRLGADLGLSDDDLLEMYRMVALARAVDERMWILNRAGRIPFVISGQGHEGAQVGVAWALRNGPRLDRPVLPLDRDVPDLRDERPGHHARPVRQGQRPVVGRPPDARPLRRSRGTTCCRSARRSRPRSCTPSGSPWRPRSGTPARSRWRRWARARRTRATSTRASTSRRSTSCRSCSWSRTTATPSACRRRCEVSVPDVAMRAAGYGIPGVVVDGADVLACYAAARTAVERARAGDGPDPDRGQGDPADGALVGRPADEVPHRGGARRREGPRRVAALPRPAPRRRRPDRGGRGGAWPRRSRRSSTDATDFAEAEPDPDPSTAMRWVYAEDWPSETPPPWGLGDG